MESILLYSPVSKSLAIKSPIGAFGTACLIQTDLTAQSCIEKIKDLDSVV